jgi:MoxR-like ATPase
MAIDADQEVARFHTMFAQAVTHIHKTIVGQTDAIEYSLLGLIAGGHILLEGAPGLGKTRLVKILSRVFTLQFSRVQFTPDLMPADILGTNILTQNEGGERVFSFQPGPVFGNIVLADEINRGTPKTQSALLEAMEERAVTIQGRRYALPNPFFVMATQNPIEMEGVYPLPEAQLDRFMFKIEIGAPPADDMRAILDVPVQDVETKPLFKMDDLLALQRTLGRVPAANVIKDYAVRIYRATHPNSPEAPSVTKKYIRYGCSPRGAQALLLAARGWALLSGRFNVSTADIQRVVLPVLGHRIIRNFEAEAASVGAGDILGELVRSVGELPPR